MPLMLPALAAVAVSLVSATADSRMDRGFTAVANNPAVNVRQVDCQHHLAEIGRHLPSRSADRYPEVQRVLALFQQAVSDCDRGRDLAAMEQIAVLRRDLALVDRQNVRRGYPTARP